MSQVIYRPTSTLYKAKANHITGMSNVGVAYPPGTHSRHMIGCCLIPWNLYSVGVDLKITWDILPMEKDMYGGCLLVPFIFSWYGVMLVGETWNQDGSKILSHFIFICSNRGDQLRRVLLYITINWLGTQPPLLCCFKIFRLIAVGFWYSGTSWTWPHITLKTRKIHKTKQFDISFSV